MNDEERIITLELRFLSQQDEIEKLSEVVYEQQLLLTRLESELRRMREFMASSPWEGSFPNEKPPHY